MRSSYCAVSMLCVALLLVACASTGATFTRNIEFDIHPAGTKVALTYEGENTPFATCLTPCTLTHDVTKNMTYEMTLDGKLDKTGPLKKIFEVGGQAVSYVKPGTNTIPGTVINGHMESAGEKDERLANLPEMQRRQEQVLDMVYNGGVDAMIADRTSGKSGCRAGSSLDSSVDPKPTIRIPPVFPFQATRSGHCKMRFNVDPDGDPVDIQVVSCSDDVFEENSKISLLYWKYAPALMDGSPVYACGIETKISYQLSDERGKIVPE
ncbi:energy transducer TonB [Robiginitomaculum antarcticum]|uniref:energy transducer TonB n=1 Tax=Robiginitomaculum antarcticum TaxID=437507 RepID=UPI000A043564|nr:energy transducer TonB [Robiginitomaculum antarcticum]